MKQKQYMKSGYNDIIRQRKKSIEKNKTKKPEKKVFKTNPPTEFEYIPQKEVTNMQLKIKNKIPIRP